MTPRLESRISALEKRASALEATAEELTSDNKALFDHVQQGFAQAHTYIRENIETRLVRIEATQTEHTERLGRIETTMAEILALLKQSPGE